MNHANDEWRVWQWTLACGLSALALLAFWRVASQGIVLLEQSLRVADRAIDAYERSQAPIVQRTVTDWPTGEARQSVETHRMGSEDLATWSQQHDAAVILTDRTARDRGAVREGHR